MAQAWLITRVDVDKKGKLIITFFALLNPDISSEVMLQITNDIYHTSMRTETGYAEHAQANFIYLPDGSPHKGTVVCGHHPGLWACRAYDVFITFQDEEGWVLQWREPHVMTEGGVPYIEYWEEFLIPVSFLGHHVDDSRP